MKAILYTTGCPKCKMLESRLDKICEFEKVTDVDEIVKFAKEHNLKSEPILAIDDKVYTFEEALKALAKIN